MPRTRADVLQERISSARALGRRLARAREAAGLTQEAVGRALGVPQSRIAKLELGTRTLTFIEGLRFAQLYSIEPHGLDPAVPELEPE